MSYFRGSLEPFHQFQQPGATERNEAKFEEEIATADEKLC